jgi:tryptophan synthase beta chain
VDQALACREAGEAKTIVFAFSGHGHFDLGAYDNYLAGELVDYPLPEEELQRSLAGLPQV